MVQQLAGSRPLSPDSKPIIGPVPGREGVLLATGHTTKGIHLGPITSRIITDYICSGSTQVVSDLANSSRTASQISPTPTSSQPPKPWMNNPRLLRPSVHLGMCIAGNEGKAVLHPGACAVVKSRPPVLETVGDTVHNSIFWGSPPSVMVAAGRST